MTTQELKAQAKAEARNKYNGLRIVDSEIEAAVDEGLNDGDKVGVGGNVVAHIEGDEVIFRNGDTEGGREKYANLSRQQIDRLVVLNAIHKGVHGVQTGTIKGVV